MFRSKVRLQNILTRKYISQSNKSHIGNQSQYSTVRVFILSIWKESKDNILLIFKIKSEIEETETEKKYFWTDLFKVYLGSLNKCHL